jgi:hypothetical protein
MDAEQLQNIEKRLNDQAEATQVTNEMLNKLLAVFSTQEVREHLAPPPLASPPPVTTPLKVSQPSRVKPGIPSNFDGDRVQGRAFLTSCELYKSLTQSDFFEDQVRIHWALSYFKGRRTATFAKHIIWQEMRTGKMCFASWDKFREEFTAAFCPENEATTALMQLESDRYFQGKWNIEAYIDEFKDLVNLSGYTDPIAIILKFRCRLNSMTQNRIAESGTDRPQDRDFNGWFKAAQCLDLNCLANEAFHYASRCPLPNLHLHRRLTPLPHALCSLSSAHRPPPPPRPLQQCTPLHAHSPLVFQWTSTALRLPNPSCRHATAVARLVTSVENATYAMMSAT